MQATQERFSDRKHLIPAGWAMLTGLLTGVICLWLGTYIASGPQEVTVTNPVDTVVIADHGIPTQGISAEQLEMILQRALEGASSPRSLPSSSVAVPQGRDIDGTVIPNSASNPIKTPLYDLPSNVKGWTQRSLNAFAIGSCPANTISRGDVITVRFDLLNPEVVKSATPIYVRLTEWRDGDIVAQRFEQQYMLREGSNVIMLGGRMTNCTGGDRGYLPA